jgi:hypothetical protein
MLRYRNIRYRREHSNRFHFHPLLVVKFASERLHWLMSNDLVHLAADRYEIADALHRFAFGLDHGDADSLASALTEDCVVDFRPAGKKLGIDFPKLSGRQAILDAIIPLLGPLDTSHTVSNLQIEISEDSATLYCYVMAQHFMPREGARPGAENALLMNRYDCELVRDGQKWRFTRMTIDNAWAQGNPEILNALATQRVLSTKQKPAK